jgi:hypothetical protein
MPVRAEVRWEVDDDAAWVPVGPGYYTHYSGVHLAQKDKQWHATAYNGDLTSGHKTAFDAMKSLHGNGLWHLSQFEGWSREYGPVRHTCCPAKRDEPMHFVFWAPPDVEFSIIREIDARATVLRHGRP